MMPGRRAVGVLVKSTDRITEPDLRGLCPDSMRLLAARVQLTPGDPIERMEPDLAAACGLLAHVTPECVAFACTSATLAHGLDFDRLVADRIEDLMGCPVVTAASAMCDSARERGIRRALLVSPYPDPVDESIAAAFGSFGTSVVGTVSIRPREIFTRGFLDRFPGTGNRLIEPAWIHALVLEAARGRPGGFDGVIIPCTGVRATEAIAPIEADLAVPVVAANQAIAVALGKALAAPPAAEPPGSG